MSDVVAWCETHKDAAPKRWALCPEGLRRYTDRNWVPCSLLQREAIDPNSPSIFLDHGPKLGFPPAETWVDIVAALVDMPSGRYQRVGPL